MDCTKTQPLIRHDVSLRPYHSFGLDCVADALAEVNTAEELRQLIDEHPTHRPFALMGGGCNMVFPDRYKGLVIRIGLKGIRKVDEDDEHIFVEAAAGENWNGFVRHCIANRWYGLENLVAIPGTVGASAVQNIGAYGCEAADRIWQVKAIDMEDATAMTLDAEECRFGYRDSVFKHRYNRHAITSVVFRLQKRFFPNASYTALADKLAAKGALSDLTAQQMADTIEEIRWTRLPHPEAMGNAGSFFKNPVISAKQYQQLKASYPSLVAHPSGEGYKVSAAWLIDQCGWRGRKTGGCGVYEKNALILVNLGGCTFEDINRLSHDIVADIERRYGITLEREVAFNTIAQ